ncbi:MAG: DUF1684 domain-containing protein [Candidatus Didemnitutus sp.]|nr:DUF1684 domain-containing protein [Candidatus Didemnitutus sp.]
MLRHLGLLLSLAVALAAPATRADDTAFQRELETWRADRVARLTAPDSWLSLIGLHWLEAGENTVGSAETNRLRLAAGPAQLGRVLVAAEGTVHFVPAPGVEATADGVRIDPAAADGVALDYRGARPTLVRSGTLSFLVIQRGEKLGLRVRDSESPRRRNFVGIDYFPADPAWRIEADWVPFAPPREIPITNILGQTSSGKMPGQAVFTHEGRTFTLLPVGESADETLFFIISDATSGDETYGAARFVYAAPPKDGKIILDFNRAQNPPCAFTPFATCPLPPKENRLPIRITAGEKNYRGEAH